jgi:hypothetical protein
VTDAFILTFAEIEFLLSSRPQRAGAVRADLRITESDRGPAVLRAGLASLLARGLCAENAETVTPGREVTAVVAALSTAGRHLVAAGWRGERPEVMHLYSGAAARLALFPNQRGRYTAEFLDPAEPLSAPLLRFVDAFSAYATDGRESALVIKAEPVADADGVAGGAELSVAVSIDASGTWYVSDSVRSAERGVPTSRDQVARRLAELMDESRGQTATTTASA